jgi:predicted nucleic acid-binding protein
MKRLLFDTNIILDVLQDREPHVEPSAAVWSVVERGEAEGAVSAHSITTIHYLIRKEIGNAKARSIILKVLKVFEIAAVNRDVIDQAFQYHCPDFEDAVTAAAAQAASCDYVVTRDPKGFRGSPLRCITPEAAIPLLQKQ